MKITPNSKISELIKANPESIAAIASINKHFEKLRNPILRKLMAHRVTIADAAKIGGVPVQKFFEVLAPLGFTYDNEISAPGQDNETDFATQNSITQNPSKHYELSTNSLTMELDVRNDIKQGNDPFNKIMGAIRELPEDQTLLLINSFEPIPLIRILKNKGYECTVERPSSEVVHTYIKKSEDVKSAELPSVPSENDFEAIKNALEGRLKEIDVRELEMPLPMVTILQNLEGLKCDEGLFVHHKKIPQYLLPELQERGYKWVANEISAGNVKLIIYR